MRTPLLLAAMLVGLMLTGCTQYIYQGASLSSDGTLLISGMEDNKAIALECTSTDKVTYKCKKRYPADAL